MLCMTSTVIPNYVLISPKGKIVKMWSGYGKRQLEIKDA